MRRVLKLALPALFLFVAVPASAQDLPGCSPSNANERICRSNNICVCRMTGGLLSGIPQAFRWDCGIHNGGCIPGTYEQMSPFPAQGAAPSLPSSRATAPSRAAATPAAGAGPGKAEIAKAQAALARLGYQTGPADGVVGPRTRTALQAYLAKEGLPPSDRITPEIYRRLVP